MQDINFIYAEFAEYPMNISLPIGFEIKAVFRCRHQSSGAFIVWIVNTSQAVHFLPDITTGFVRDNDTTVHTLTIPARSEYSGTEVVCRASFDKFPTEVTPPVTLTIIAGLLATHLNYYTVYILPKISNMWSRHGRGLINFLDVCNAT